MVLAGVFIALGLREFAEVCLPGRDRPWYCRPGALLFLLISLAVVNALALRLVKNVISIPMVVQLFAMLAVELFGIAMLDPPAREPKQRDARPAPSSVPPTATKPRNTVVRPPDASDSPTHNDAPGASSDYM